MKLDAKTDNTRNIGNNRESSLKKKNLLVILSCTGKTFYFKRLLFLMENIKDILLAFFEDEVKEVRVVMEKAKDVSLDFRLTEDSRTLLELVNHIAQIPRIDVDIYSGKFPSSEETHKFELQLNKENIGDALNVFDDCCVYLRKYFEKLTDEDLLKKTLRPFYEPDSSLRSWAHFLPKLTSHLALHKGVLWSYLKAANANVTMFTYYGAK